MFLCAYLVCLAATAGFGVFCDPLWNAALCSSHGAPLVRGVVGPIRGVERDDVAGGLLVDVFGGLRCLGELYERWALGNAGMVGVHRVCSCDRYIVVAPEGPSIDITAPHLLVRSVLSAFFHDSIENVIES